MKVFTTIVKVLAALAAVVGAVYVAATYGEKIVAWAKKMLVNTAKSGYFSSDRTIAQYNRDIWHLK